MRLRRPHPQALRSPLTPGKFGKDNAPDSIAYETARLTVVTRTMAVFEVRIPVMEIV